MSIEAVDMIYANALETMQQHGEDSENRPIQQILLRDDRFYGYLFQGERIQVVWTAEDQELHVSFRELNTTNSATDTSSANAKTEESSVALPSSRSKKNRRAA